MLCFYPTSNCIYICVPSPLLQTAEAKKKQALMACSAQCMHFSLLLVSCIFLLALISLISSGGSNSSSSPKPVYYLPAHRPIYRANPDVVSHSCSHRTPPRTASARKKDVRKRFKDESNIFHNRWLFMKNYLAMKKKFKIYVYPHRADHPFANVLLPLESEPSGNYASESYFKKALMQSHFMTNDPVEADLFFLPFSISMLRQDSRVNVTGLQDFFKDYILNISQEFPYWNRTNGADHFYVACHSAGRNAMDKLAIAKANAIQVACSSSYYVSGYVAHKDASLPQIWPRYGNFAESLIKERHTLAFFAGQMNSPVRARLLEVWKGDNEISVHSGRLSTSYTEALQKSKFCLHVKGYEVNTARVGDALFYGCVPIIISNHYDLPFNDILNWKAFSIVIATLDIPLLKDVLRNITREKYVQLQNNVVKARNHFQWHVPPVDYDAFYMVMYELWLRRPLLRVNLK